MKSKIYVFCAVVLILSSCKKSGVETVPLASINVTNAIVNSSALTVNTTRNTILYARNPIQIGFGANMAFTMKANDIVPISITDIADSTKAVYQTTLNVLNGNYYSLFLSGQTGTVDAILVKDTYKNYADSVCGIRFINLSSDSNPISINIEGNTFGSEVNGLAYKSYTGFKIYTSNSLMNSYNFEFRDAATGNLLATYALSPTPMYHNATLALIGLENGSGVNVEQIPNY